MNNVGALALDGNSAWRVGGNSDVGSLAMKDSALMFEPRGNGTHSTVTVRGDFSGSGATVGFNTTMNAGGALANQATDRLLIEGSVTTTGPTAIQVTPGGAGANTDTNGNGKVDADEGISLIQVAGDSRRDAFTLRGGYVAAGPFQYTLHAFGPGETDAGQNLLASGKLNWDYRLGNKIVCDGDCPLDPETGEPDPGNPGDPGEPEIPERVAVVPQLPSYVSAPAALLTYGDMMTDGLRQRLGDIRQGESHDPVGGEMFARYLGGQLRYSSNRSFKNYGYGFDQQVNALQLGGSLIALDGDDGTLRAGWAVDHGTTRVSPKAADGNSSAKYRANGVSGWLTWQHGGGFWIDGVVGAIRYRGDVGTDLRGADVARIRAHGWMTSVEAGMPFALGNAWTVEPRFQLKHQSLNFRDFVDGDNLSVELGTAKQTSATIGGRLSRMANPVFMPYVGVDLTHTSNGDPRVDVSSEEWNIADRFGSGRVGNAYRVSLGAVSQLGRNVQVYGEGTYRHFVGGYGMQGLAGNIGVRVTF
nr:autotransporter outer membrane beta-barrel domain-containing protein [Luteibacter yeojuensis]